MKKFESVMDLLKTGGLHDHFKKAASFHKANHSAHESIAKAHSDYAAVVKAKHDGMDDGDANKAFMKAHADFHLAKAAHHTMLSALHKGYSDHHNAVADGMEDEKSAAARQKCAHDIEMTKACDKCNRKAAEPASPLSLDNLFSGALKGEFDEFKKSDEFKTMLREVMRREAAKALGLELEPTKVFGTIPTNQNITLVKRPGGFDPDKEAAEIDAANPVAAEVFGS